MVTGKPLLTAEQISHRVRELGDMITEDYSGKKLLAVGILKGA
ncbi:MAG TPA: hypoxanthine phosphoribosyltransferase, partial [Nitrospirae bacterium]|nr:hypoxanthine phosphoribosyltransferase [Nitrospirota bacterium]